MYVKVAVLTVVAGVACSAPDQQKESLHPPGVCRSLESPIQGNLRYGLPRDWSLEDPVVVDYEGMRRTHDDAPSSAVATWLVDAEGQRVYEDPAVIIFRGGTTAEFEQYPKDTYSLNDVSERAFQAGFDALDESARATRRPRRNASSLTPPFSESDSIVQKAIRCLVDGLVPVSATSG